MGEAADIERLAAALSRTRFLVDDEKRLQADIAAALTAKGLAYKREVRLSAADVIDFLVGRVGIEVKIKGTKRAILRQVERYSGSERLDSIILLTSLALGLPESINGKPVRIVSIGRGWL